MRFLTFHFDLVYGVHACLLNWAINPTTFNNNNHLFHHRWAFIKSIQLEEYVIGRTCNRKSIQEHSIGKNTNCHRTSPRTKIQDYCSKVSKPAVLQIFQIIHSITISSIFSSSSIFPQAIPNHFLISFIQSNFPSYPNLSHFLTTAILVRSFCILVRISYLILFLFLDPLYLLFSSLLFFSWLPAFTTLF